VHLGDVSLAGLTGLTVEDMRLTPVRRTGEVSTRGVAAGEDEAGIESRGGGDGPPVVSLPTRIEYATVTANLFSLIGGDPELSFEIGIGDGEIWGSYHPDESVPGGHVLEFSVSDVNLLGVGMLSNTAQTAVSGRLNCAGASDDGQSYATLRYDEGRQLSGADVICVIRGLSCAPGYLDFGGENRLYLSAPTRLGDFRFELDFDGSDADVSLSASGGEDIEMELGGRLNVRSPFVETYAVLNLQIGFTAEWKNENDLSGPLGTIPLLRRACQGEQCAMRIIGPITDLRTQALR
jgi:hypothetical protein